MEKIETLRAFCALDHKTDDELKDFLAILDWDLEQAIEMAVSGGLS